VLTAEDARLPRPPGSRTTCGRRTPPLSSTSSTRSTRSTSRSGTGCAPARSPVSTVRAAEPQRPRPGTPPGGPAARAGSSLPAALTLAPEWERTEARFAELTAQGVDPGALVAGCRDRTSTGPGAPTPWVKWSLNTTAEAWAAAQHRPPTGTRTPPGMSPPRGRGDAPGTACNRRNTANTPGGRRWSPSPARPGRNPPPAIRRTHQYSTQT